MSSFVLAWFCCVVQVMSLIGVGSLLRKKLRLEELSRPMLGVLAFFALGVASMALNFFVPLGDIVTFALLTFGTFFYLRSLRKPLVLECAAVILGSLFVTWLSAQGFVKFDTGLYHLPKILMIDTSNLVIGSANLNPRFGFNSIFHYSAASMSLAQRLPESVFSVLPSIQLLFSMALSSFLVSLPKDRSSRTTAKLAVAFFPAVFLIGDFLWVEYLSWPNTDWAATLLLFSGSLCFVHSSERVQRCGLMLLLGAGLTKLSVLFVALPCFLYFLGRKKRPSNLWRQEKGLIAMVFFSLCVYLIHGFFVSGCWAFPEPSTCPSFASWGVGADLAQFHKLSITTWARWQGEVGHGDWFPAWLDRLIDDPFFKRAHLLWLPGFALSIFLFFWRKPQFSQALPLAVLLLSSSLGLAVWFFGAPDPRFAYGTYAVFVSVLLCLPMASNRFEALPRVGFWFFKAAPIAVGVFFFLRMFITYLPTSERVREANDHYIIRETHTQSEINGVQISDESGQCWLAPFPCLSNRFGTPTKEVDVFLWRKYTKK